MDRNFARSLSLVLKNEGGWSDIAADPGGATQKGITLATYRSFIKPGGSKADLRAITDEQVATVYREEYWGALNCASLPDGVDFAAMDFGVNSGVGRAARYLQQIVGVATDGVIGPATITAVKAKPAADVINKLCDMRLGFLQRLPTWPTFGRGWAIRVASVRAAALQMASQPAQPASPVPVSPAPVQPAPVTVPKPPKTVPVRHVGIGAGVVGIAAAIATYWHELVAWVEHFFH